MTVRVKLDGIDKLERVLRNLDRITQNALANALTVEAEAIMANSKKYHVPVDTGTLRASGRVMPPEIKGGVVSIELGYGGAASAYALPVHELPDETNWTQAYSGSKYLERPVVNAAKGLERRLARDIGPAIERQARRLGGG